MTQQMLRGLICSWLRMGTQQQIDVGDNVPLISDDQVKLKKKKGSPLKSNTMNTVYSNSTIQYTSLQQQILPDIQPNINPHARTSTNQFLHQHPVHKTPSLRSPHEYIMYVFDR